MGGGSVKRKLPMRSSKDLKWELQKRAHEHTSTRGVQAKRFTFTFAEQIKLSYKNFRNAQQQIRFIESDYCARHCYEDLHALEQLSTEFIFCLFCEKKIIITKNVQFALLKFALLNIIRYIGIFHTI